MNALIQASNTNMDNKNRSCLTCLYCVTSTLAINDTTSPLYIIFRELIHASLMAVGFNNWKKQKSAQTNAPIVKKLKAFFQGNFWVNIEWVTVAKQM